MLTDNKGTVPERPAGFRIMILGEMDMFWWIVATLCAFFVKGLCGFANTLVFSSILSFGSSNLNITPVEVLLGFPTNLILAWRERKGIRWKLCIPLILLVLAGNIPGMLLLKTVDAGSLKIFFGFVIAGIGAEMLVREYQTASNGQEARNQRTASNGQGARSRGTASNGRGTRGQEPGLPGLPSSLPGRLPLLFIGILSGVLSGMFGIGAMLAAYISRVTDDSHGFKANMCAIFIVENLFRIFLYLVSGILTPGVLWQAALLFPAMLAGLAAGIRSSSLLNERVVRKLVLVMLVVSGISLAGGEILDWVP